MTDEQLIKVLGGVTAVAKLLGITPPSVSGWKAIPLDKKNPTCRNCRRLWFGHKKRNFPR